jgi:hypothetical protein
MQAENMNFSEKGVQEALRKNIMILWNVYSFYEMYAGDETGNSKSENILDQWIIARLYILIETATKAMSEYNLPKALLASGLEKRDVTKSELSYELTFLRITRCRTVFHSVGRPVGGRARPGCGAARRSAPPFSAVTEGGSCTASRSGEPGPATCC